MVKGMKLSHASVLKHQTATVWDNFEIQAHFTVNGRGKELHSSKVSGGRGLTPDPLDFASG